MDKDKKIQLLREVLQEWLKHYQNKVKYLKEKSNEK